MSVILTKIPSPLNLDISIKIIHDYVPGKKLDYYINGHIPANSDGITWVVAKNGLVIRDFYSTITVEDNDKIAICAKQEGGLAAAIALSAASIAGGTATYVGVGTVLTTLGMAVYGAVYLATMFVIGYGMSMLTSALGQSTPPGGGDTTVEQTYGWDALSPTSNEGIYIPYYYGTNKVAGHIINQFVKVSEVDDEEEILYMLLALCDHELDSITSIEINDNPSTYYKDTTTYTRLGTTTDTLIPGFDELITQNNVGSELVYQSSVTVQTQGECEKIDLILAAPSGFYYTNKKGKLDSRSATYSIKYRVTGETEWTDFVTDETWSGKTTSSLKKTVSIDGLSLNYYDVYIIRTNTAETSFRGKSDIYLSSIQEIVKEELTYPGLAKYAVKILATDQLSGGAPTLTCITTRSTVSVYNPYTTSWVSKSATNPAWICYDLLIQHEIPTSRILYDEFLEWANYCDTDIGGGEKRIEINTVIQGGNVWEQIQKIANMGRGVIIRRNTKYGVFIDKPDTNVYHLFTMGNITEDTFSIQYLPKTDRASAVEIEYTDVDRDYTRQVVTVYSDDYVTDTSTAQQKATVSMAASMTQAQAVREGVFRINSNKYLVRVVSFDAFIDSFACVVGDIFEFQHESINYLTEDIGGLIEAAGNDDGSGNPYITIDKPVLISSGNVYKIKVRLSDDTLVEKTIDTSGISDFSEPFQTFNLTQSWSTIPSKDDLYAFGKAATYLKKYRITSVTKKDDLTKSIVGIEYIDEIYTDNDGYVIEEPTWNNEKQEAVQVLLNEYLSYSNDGGYISNISVSWHRSYSTLSSNWSIWLQDDTAGTPPIKVGRATECKFNILNDLTIGHTYTVYITLEEQGLVDTGSNSATITLLGKEDPPDDVLNFNGVWNPIRRVVNFTWSANPDIDIWGYEIRQGAWVDENVIAKVTGTSTSTFIAEGTSESIIYRIKAIDETGIYSTNDVSTTVAIDTSQTNLTVPGGLTLSSQSVITNDGTNVVILTASWDSSSELSDDFHHYDVLLEDISISKNSMYNTTSNEYIWEVIPNRQYGVSLRAVDVSGNSTSWTTQETITTAKDETPPNVPTSLTASGTFTNIILNWSHSNEADLIGFNVYRNTVDNSSTASLIGSGIGEFSGTFGSYNDSPTTTDTYFYWVTAVDTSGNESGFSNSDSAAAEGVAIGPGDITETMIADNAISTPKLQANSVVSSKILAGEIGTDHLSAGAVTATKIDVTNLAAINADMGTITAGRIQNSGNTTYIDLTNDLMSLGGKLTWDGVDLAVNGSVTITGGSGYENLTDKPTDSDIYNSYNALQSNLLPYSSFSNTDGWSQYSSAGATDTEFGIDYNINWMLENEHVGYLRQPSDNGDPDSDYSQIFTGYLNAVEGQRYCFSVYLQVLRCKGVIYIEFRDAYKQFLGYGSFSYIYADDSSIDGKYLERYLRRSVFGTAPTNTKYMRAYIRKYATEDSQVTSYLFFCRAQLSEASVNQTEPSTYVLSGTDNPAGVINSGTVTIDGGKLTAGSVTADRIVSNSITAGQLAAGCITASEVGTNEIIANTANIKDLVVSGAKIANLTVDTVKIKDNAVTVPVQYYNVNDITVSGTGYTTVAFATITSSGQPIHIGLTFSRGGAVPGYAALYRDTDLLVEYSCPDAHWATSFSDVPTSGEYTYYLKCKTTETFYSFLVARRSMLLLECKK